MRRPSRLLCLTAFAAFAAMLPACGGNAGKNTDPNRKVKVAFVTNMTAEFWNIAKAGATKAGRDFNAEVDFRQPSVNSVADQMQIVKDLVRLGVDGIAVSVINPTEQSPQLKPVAAETNLITVDNDAKDSGRKCYIGPDNYAAGKAAGRLLQKAMPDGGTVAVFIGSTASANANDRIGGLIDQLAGTKDAPRTPGAKLGKFTLDQIHTDGGDQKQAQDIANAVIAKLGSNKIGYVGLYAYNPGAILRAAESKGVAGKVAIVGFDEDAATIRGIEENKIAGTVVQNPFEYGYKAIEILAAIARGDMAKAVDTPVAYRVVTKAGGPPETIDGTTVEHLTPAQFTAKLNADLASAK